MDLNGTVPASGCVLGDVGVAVQVRLHGAGTVIRSLSRQSSGFEGRIVLWPDF